jgi:hypothetical protein
MFQASATCSYHQYFDKCWMIECARLWHFEFGCAVGAGDGQSPGPHEGRHERGPSVVRAKEGERRCTTPFAKTLLQVKARPVTVK